MSEPYPMPIKPQLGTAESFVEENPKRLSQQLPRFVVLADLNVDPPEADGDDSVHVSAPDLTRFLSVFTFLCHPILFFIFFLLFLLFIALCLIA